MKEQEAITIVEDDARVGSRTLFDHLISSYSRRLADVAEIVSRETFALNYEVLRKKVNGRYPFPRRTWIIKRPKSISFSRNSLGEFYIDISSQLQIYIYVRCILELYLDLCFKVNCYISMLHYGFLF